MDEVVKDLHRQDPNWKSGAGFFWLDVHEATESELTLICSLISRWIGLPTSVFSAGLLSSYPLPEWHTLDPIVVLSFCGTVMIKDKEEYLVRWGCNVLAGNRFLVTVNFHTHGIVRTILGGALSGAGELDPEALFLAIVGAFSDAQGHYHRTLGAVVEQVDEKQHLGEFEAYRHSALDTRPRLNNALLEGRALSHVISSIASVAGIERVGSSFLSKERELHWRQISSQVALLVTFMEERSDNLRRIIDESYVHRQIALDLHVGRLTTIATYFVPLALAVSLMGISFEHYSHLPWFTTVIGTVTCFLILVTLFFLVQNLVYAPYKNRRLEAKRKISPLRTIEKIVAATQAAERDWVD